MRYGNGKATKEKFDVSRDGSERMWTGDARYLYFSIGSDSIKKMIKISGYQVAPAELGPMLSSHPQITDITVVGKPKEELGRVTQAFVVPNAGKSLKRNYRSCLRRECSVCEVGWMEKIGKTPSGKILRPLYKDSFKTRKADESEALNSSSVHAVHNSLRSSCHASQTNPSQSRRI